MKIVYFSPIAYSDLKQRPQYFAEGLSEKHQVYYIEPTKRIFSYIRNKENCGSVQMLIKKNLTVFRCDGKFVFPFRWNVYDLLYLNGLYEYRQIKTIVEQADLIIVGFEGWYNVVRNIKNKKIIYDKMDENSLILKDWANKTYLKKCEKLLIEKCVLMFVSAAVFKKTYEKRLPTYLISNAFDGKNVFWTQKKEKESEKVIYGYVGTIGEWFDNRVIEKIAENENCEVILVGPCMIEQIEKKNVKYVGKVEKEKVETYIKSFDVCLYPFKQGELLDTINPVKIYEYLAFNKPVLAVYSKEMKQFEDYIYTYQNYRGLENLCKQKLCQPFESEEKYNEFIKENCWDSRIKQINHVLEELS